MRLPTLKEADGQATEYNESSLFQGDAVQKSNQRLDSFISEITSGEALPVPENEEAAEEAIWSGDITEIDRDTYSFYMDGNAGRPKMVQDDWFIFSKEKTGAERGMVFGGRVDRFFARHMDQEQWDKFIKAAKVVQKFW